MRIATISHSHIHIRQQLFFREVSMLGHDVLMIAPGQWHDLRTAPLHEERFEVATCRHIGGEHIYQFQFLGAKEALVKFAPDWLYIQGEPGANMVRDALAWAKELGCKTSIFTWENQCLKGDYSGLADCDLVICGNKEAENLVKPYNRSTAVMLQVGIDTGHLMARPDVKRSIPVGFIGRPAPEKGTRHLSLAWPTAQFMTWVDYKMIPWAFSQVQVIVAYSQDTPAWKEQAPPYVAIEALSCGCKVVTSDTASSVFWLKDCPAVFHVPQGRVMDLRTTIQQALESNAESRQWVVDRFSNPVMAKKLVEVLENGERPVAPESL